MKAKYVPTLHLVTMAIAFTAISVVARAKPATAQTHEAQPASAASSEARANVNQALEAYERIRAKLARDELAVIDDAANLQRAAGRAASSAPEGQRVHLRAIADAAGRLKDMAKDDGDALRRAFGEVSRPIVALLSGDASLRANRHLFECPMAQGYKKWVQTSDQISNPYMGQRMPGCGSRSRWE